MPLLSRLALFTLTAATPACLGNLSLAPHLNRESDLATPAAAGRYGTVLERAQSYEQQNQTSKDVHWYRTWRAVAMIGLGQPDQALALLERVLADVSAAPKAPAQPNRLRMFIYDLEAEANVAKGAPAAAVALLDKAYAIAERVELESGGDCHRDLMLSARLARIERVAAQAGQAPRAARARADLGPKLDAWAKCVRAADYPALSAMPALAAALKDGPVPVAAVVPKTNARLPPPAPPPPAAPPPPPAPPRPAAGSFAALPTTGGAYAPVAAAPWQAGLDALAPLLDKRAPGARTSVVVRTDGRHHALRIALARPAAAPAELTEVFKSAVVFFETTRAVSPEVTQVVVDAGQVSVVADKSAIFDLFLGRLDPPGFVARLRRL